MASFSENFNGSLSAWSMSTTPPIDRNWWTENGLLKTEDAVAGKYGLILHNDIQDENGTLRVGYDTIDLYNATDNLVVYRFNNIDDFSFFAIEPGQNDTRGVSFGVNDITQLDPNIEMYNPYNATSANPVNPEGKLSLEVTPNKTIIPQSGIVELSYNGHYHHITLYNTDNTFVASGDYVSTNNNNIHSGYVGFAHTDKWNANINGWGFIDVNSGSVIHLPPTIESFSATSYQINIGETSTLGWKVSSGTDNTTVMLFPINTTVSLSDIYDVTPTTTTTYSLSAWNVAGSDYKEFDITVIENYPKIIDFSNNGPILPGNISTLNWTISGGTSAFIDNNIGWITPYISAGTIDTPVLYNDTTYTITSYDDYGYIDTKSTQVDVLSLPTATIYTTGTPICSGAPFELLWNTTNSTSAYINNGIGSVPLSGSMIVSASMPTIYTISAMNNNGIDENSTTVVVYYRDPIAYIGDDVYVNSETGNPVSVHLDGSQSYDPDGRDLGYIWSLSGYGIVSNDEAFDYDYPVGTNYVDLVVYDNCGNSATDDVKVVVTSNIPPIAIATVDKPILNNLGFVTLDGTQSYSPGASIVSYNWYLNGTIIGGGPIVDYHINEFGSHTFELVVISSNGLRSNDYVDVLVTVDANPIADAGDDIQVCSDIVNTIILDGSNSTPPPIGGSLTWYEYDLSDLGLPSVAEYITSPSEISATIVTTNTGEFNATLTVKADNGYTDTDNVKIDIYPKPSVSGMADDYNVSHGEVVANVTLSAFSDIIDVTYVWTHNNWVSTEQFPTIVLSPGVYDVNLKAVDNHTGCESDNEIVTVNVSGSDLEIVEFEITPFTYIFNDVPYADVDLSWTVVGADNIDIDVLGNVSSHGTSAIRINPPGGNYTYSISAYSGSYMETKTIYAYYNFTYNPVRPIVPPSIIPPIEICKVREKIIKTYGIDELKYGKDRKLNLVNYLPEYVRNTGTETILQEFEDYLNNMYIGQANYTWDENVLDVEICKTKECNQWTSCNDIEGCSGVCSTSGDCNNLATSAINNTYSLDVVNNTIIPITPADSAGEVFINNMCNLKNDKISILDKIFRLTDLFDPDLMPEHLIQNYAENLGYNAGINRQSIGDVVKDKKAQEIEQRRYLRFMIRNLPNWYQIKSSRSSIKIMMYSFGLIGDFVYYYTKCYSDQLVSGENGLCDNPDTLYNNDTSGAYYVQDCSLTYLSDIPEITTDKEIALNRCCIEQYLSDVNKWEEHVNNTNNITNDDWMLTTVDNTSLQEDISNIPEDKGYFSSPHFKLWIDIDDSTGNYSLSEDRQRMIKLAVDAIKPINTIYDGVAVYWEILQMLYMNPKARIRKNISIVSDYTWYSGR